MERRSLGLSFLHRIASLWADNMRTGCIFKKDAWLALHSTIWRTLCYPLPALNLTKQQCDKLIMPLLTYFLPALGVCRNFPRDLVFAPKDTPLGLLYKTSLSCLNIEVGINAPLHTISYQKFKVTPSLIKSTWAFLFYSKIELHHDLMVQAQRQADTPIMEIFLNLHWLA
jgi:hypothetical protein